MKIYKIILISLITIIWSCVDAAERENRVNLPYSSVSGIGSNHKNFPGSDKDSSVFGLSGNAVHEKQSRAAEVLLCRLLLVSGFLQEFLSDGKGCYSIGYEKASLSLPKWTNGWQNSDKVDFSAELYKTLHSWILSGQQNDEIKYDNWGKAISFYQNTKGTKQAILFLYYLQHLHDNEVINRGKSGFEGLQKKFLSSLEQNGIFNDVFKELQKLDANDDYKVDDKEFVTNANLSEKLKKTLKNIPNIIKPIWPFNYEKLQQIKPVSLAKYFNEKGLDKQNTPELLDRFTKITKECTKLAIEYLGKRSAEKSGKKMVELKYVYKIIPSDTLRKYLVEYNNYFELMPDNWISIEGWDLSEYKDIPSNKQVELKQIIAFLNFLEQDILKIAYNFGDQRVLSKYGALSKDIYEGDAFKAVVNFFHEQMTKGAFPKLNQQNEFEGLTSAYFFSMYERLMHCNTGQSAGLTEILSMVLKELKMIPDAYPEIELFQHIYNSLLQVKENAEFVHNQPRSDIKERETSQISTLYNYLLKKLDEQVVSHPGYHGNNPKIAWNRYYWSNFDGDIKKTLCTLVDWYTAYFLLTLDGEILKGIRDMLALKGSRYTSSDKFKKLQQITVSKISKEEIEKLLPSGDVENRAKQLSNSKEFLNIFKDWCNNDHDHSNDKEINDLLNNPKQKTSSELSKKLLNFYKDKESRLKNLLLSSDLGVLSGNPAFQLIIKSYLDTPAKGGFSSQLEDNKKQLEEWRERSQSFNPDNEDNKGKVSVTMVKDYFEQNLFPYLAYIRKYMDGLDRDEEEYKQLFPIVDKIFSDVYAKKFDMEDYTPLGFKKDKLNDIALELLQIGEYTNAKYQSQSLTKSDFENLLKESDVANLKTEFSSYKVKSQDGIAKILTFVKDKQKSMAGAHIIDCLTGRVSGINTERNITNDELIVVKDSLRKAALKAGKNFIEGKKKLFDYTEACLCDAANNASGKDYIPVVAHHLQLMRMIDELKE